MLTLYRILYIPILLLVLPYYLYRMIRRGGYLKGFSNRFGFMPRLDKPGKGVKRIWVHAVSVGEMLAIKPLVGKLSDLGFEIVLTTASSTGYRIASKNYADQAVLIAYFPIDFWPFSALAWSRIQPTIAVTTDSEIWPEHIHQAKLRSVPICIINGRLSDRSYKCHKNVANVTKMLHFSKLTKVLTATPHDHQRYLDIGANPDTTICTGNMKCDIDPKPILTPDEKRKLLIEMGFGNSSTPPLVILGSSTWPGEEALLLDIYKQARDQGINCRLLLVPRHAERYPELSKLLKDSGLRTNFRSIKKQAPDDTEVYVADTTGELTTISQVADIAYVGKSIDPNNGGQTPIECAALGIPMTYGPNMTNFKQVCESLEYSESAIRSNFNGEVVSNIIKLLKNSELRSNLATNAIKWHKGNQGATERTVNEILSLS